MSSSRLPEPILEEDDVTVVYALPEGRSNQHSFDGQFMDMTKKAQASLWVTEEIDIHTDVREWDTRLTQDERTFIIMVLAFFAAIDGKVAENAAINFYNMVKNAIVRFFYAIQIYIEHVHAETYIMFIEVLIKSKEKRRELIKSIEDHPIISLKGKWVEKWLTNKDLPFEERLVAFAAVEGIFFSGAFCSIFWLKKRGLMPGLTFSNELISRDEGLHCKFAVALHSSLNNKCTVQRATEIINEAIELEKKFVREILNVPLIGINADLMIQYVEFCANRLFLSIYPNEPSNCQSDYNWRRGPKNPFDWMELISLQGKTNMFEKRISEYSKAGVGTTAGTTVNHVFSLDADF